MDSLDRFSAVSTDQINGMAHSRLTTSSTARVAIPGFCFIALRLLSVVVVGVTVHTAILHKGYQQHKDQHDHRHHRRLADIPIGEGCLIDVVHQYIGAVVGPALGGHGYDQVHHLKGVGHRTHKHKYGGGPYQRQGDLSQHRKGR